MAANQKIPKEFGEAGFVEEWMTDEEIFKGNGSIREVIIDTFIVVFIIKCISKLDGEKDKIKIKNLQKELDKVSNRLQVYLQLLEATI